MKCPYCGNTKTKVIESRPTHDHTKVRRRRSCINCKRRFTTYEQPQKTLMVLKLDCSREKFDPNKLLLGIQKACRKRPVTPEKMEALVDEIEQEVLSKYGYEISSQALGELVIRKLKTLDPIAYIRFASVYKKFTDIDDFKKTIEEIQKDNN